jgi:hypothetical protein
MFKAYVPTAFIYIQHDQACQTSRSEERGFNNFWKRKERDQTLLLSINSNKMGTC